MVSYTRSRAEALGVDCSVGLMQRPERIVFIGLWTIIWGIMYISFAKNLEISGIDIFALGFLFLAITTNITALRRMLHSEALLKKTSIQV